MAIPSSWMDQLAEFSKVRLVPLLTKDKTKHLACFVWPGRVSWNCDSSLLLRISSNYIQNFICFRFHYSTTSTQVYIDVILLQNNRYNMYLSDGLHVKEQNMQKKIKKQQLTKHWNPALECAEFLEYSQIKNWHTVVKRKLYHIYITFTTYIML